jgi:hypothetical protein
MNKSRMSIWISIAVAICGAIIIVFVCEFAPLSWQTILICAYIGLVRGVSFAEGKDASNKVEE